MKHGILQATVVVNPVSAMHWVAMTTGVTVLQDSALVDPE